MVQVDSWLAINMLISLVYFNIDALCENLFHFISNGQFHWPLLRDWLGLSHGHNTHGRLNLLTNNGQQEWFINHYSTNRKKLLSVLFICELILWTRKIQRIVFAIQHLWLNSRSSVFQFLLMKILALNSPRYSRDND